MLINIYPLPRKVMSVVFFMLCASLFVLAKPNGDPFEAYLYSTPKIKEVLSEKQKGSGVSAIIIKKFIFTSAVNGNSVYAIMAQPQQEGKYPALLILHGGGSKAEDVAHHVEEYAQRGYVAICFDMPGICNAQKTPHSDGLWKSQPEGEGPRFEISEGLQHSTLLDAEVAGIEVFNLISSQANVDTKKIGITGFSWGGYSTTFLSGILGKRVKAAYSVFGCGYYEKGSFWSKLIADLPDAIRASWLEYFDAGRRASEMKAPYFLEASSNDTFFWPEAVSATLAAIRAEKNHVWDPNFNHKQMPAGPTMQKIYFDYYLKGIGRPFGSIRIAREKVQADGSKEITLLVNMPKNISVASVMLYYSESTKSWQDRTWIPITAVAQSGNYYTLTIPPDLLKKPLDYYAYVVDNRTVAVASDMVQYKPQ